MWNERKKLQSGRTAAGLNGVSSIGIFARKCLPARSVRIPRRRIVEGGETREITGSFRVGRN